MPSIYTGVPAEKKCQSGQLFSKTKKRSKGLYDATPLNEFGWLSGAMVIPIDQAAMVAASAKLKCGN